jgi:hypothetical protein
LHHASDGVIAIGVILFLPALALPFLFAFGWRHAPLVSVIASAGGLVIAAAQLYAEPWYGAGALAVFAVMAVLSLRSLRNVPAT